MSDNFNNNWQSDLGTGYTSGATSDWNFGTGPNTSGGISDWNSSAAEPPTGGQGVNDVWGGPTDDKDDLDDLLIFPNSGQPQEYHNTAENPQQDLYHRPPLSGIRMGE